MPDSLPENKKNSWSGWFYLLSFLAGAVLTFAFAPFEWRFLAILSPAVLFGLLLKAETLKQHMLLSYAFAVGMFGTGTSWIFYSMYFFAHAHIAFAISLTTLFSLLMALTFLLLGALTYQLRQTAITTRLLLFYPASWVWVEWFRGWFLTGFPWLNISNTHIDNVLVNIAPVAGGYAVSFIGTLLAGALVLLIIANTRQRIIALVTSLAIIASTFLLGKIEWTSPTGEAIKVSLLQGNIPQDRKWLPEERIPTLDLYLELTHENWDSDLIIWPETAIPGYFHQYMEDIILPLQEKGTETQTDLLIGGFFLNPEGKGNAENSILALSGDSREIYSKSHLVPFSEYVPFLEHLRWLGNLIDLPYDSVRRGSGINTMKIAGQTAQMSVCYEDVYGNETIRGLPESTLLINVSNDGWFAGSIEPEQHAEIARMRSVETGRYMLRATNVGVSAIINNKGKVVATEPAYMIKTITGMAQPYSGATPYVRVGNWLIITLLSLLLLVGRFKKK